MKAKYKAVIFDLDGTILNTLEDLADTLNHSLRKAGFPERTVDETRRFVGNGIRKLIERALPEDASAEEINRVYAEFTSYYKDHCAIKTKPYRGIEKMLAGLKEAGCRMAVISNKADFAVKSLCEFYFAGLFDITVGEREGIRKKPCPDSLLEVMRVFGTKADETLYIGDSDVDMRTAENAGTDCMIVDWGFRDRETLMRQGAKTLVSSPEEIYRYIAGER